MPILSRLRSWYARFERPISSISLVWGFIFDALTLRRVDLFWDNIWVLAHLTIVTTCAIWLNLIEEKPADKNSAASNTSAASPESDPQRLHFWLVNVMQFFFGGILSTYLIFYFRGGTLAASWPFLLILAAAFIANERLKRHYARLAFQVALLFLAYYTYAIYLLPILLHEISTRVFIASGLASLAAIAGVIGLLIKFKRDPNGRRGNSIVGKKRWQLRGIVAGIFLAINALYFLNVIPPLPLSLMDGDVYQSLAVNAPGNYTVQYEDQGGGGFMQTIVQSIVQFFRPSETIHLAPGDPLYAYTAIFAPTSLNTKIIHEWQHYEITPGSSSGESSGKWITQARVTLPIAWRRGHRLAHVFRNSKSRSRTVARERADAERRRHRTDGFRGGPAKHRTRACDKNDRLAPPRDPRALRCLSSDFSATMPSCSSTTSPFA